MAATKTRKNSTKNQSMIEDWPVKAQAPPKIKNWQWALSTVIGLILLATAILQIVSFSDFRDSLSLAGLSAPTAWAICIILAEIWGSAGFFKVHLSVAFRAVSYGLAVLVAGFWFIENLQLVASGASTNNSGYFGRFFAQQPGWWTVIQISIVLFIIVYLVGILRDKQQTASR